MDEEMGTYETEAPEVDLFVFQGQRRRVDEKGGRVDHGEEPADLEIVRDELCDLRSDRWVIATVLREISKRGYRDRELFDLRCIDVDVEPARAARDGRREQGEEDQGR